jgi:hypothetical protein
MSGSSPWTFTITSASSVSATSARRSLPVACADEGQDRLAAEAAHDVRDALVVGRDQHAIDARGAAHALVHALDHRLAVDIGERLTRQPCGTESSRDDRDDGQDRSGPSCKDEW